MHPIHSDAYCLKNDVAEVQSVSCLHQMSMSSCTEQMLLYYYYFR